jgi:cell filamentation protein
MEENTIGWTPAPDDNLLGLTDKNTINEHEAKGIAAAELYVFQLDTEVNISPSLILDVNKIAFGELYDWAGKWRNISVLVGQLQPPLPHQIPNLVYQFTDNLNYKISTCATKENHLDCLVYAHYEFIYIHPFNNGNGRTGRILMNLAAMKLGYHPINLYHRGGESRKVYIDALRQADKGNYDPLRRLINEELTAF